MFLVTQRGNLAPLWKLLGRERPIVHKGTYKCILYIKRGKSVSDKKLAFQKKDCNKGQEVSEGNFFLLSALGLENGSNQNNYCTLFY